VSVRWRIALAMAAISMAATVAVGVAAYRTTSDRLFAEVDRSLVEVDARVPRGRFDDRLPERGPFGGFEAQVIDAGGAVRQTTFGAPVAPSTEAIAVARAGAPADVFETVTVDGEAYRVRTAGTRFGAIQIARSLAETERVLASLRARVALLAALVSLIAVAAGLWIAGRVTASLRRLTDAAEHVEATGRLDVSVGERGDDEVGRLSAAFDRMLAALARSRDDQRRLVQDAGHELRTPLTSLRTNVDTLRRYPAMPDTERDAILTDLHAETEALTDLVNEVVTVASGEIADEPVDDVDLAAVAAEVAARHERRTGRVITVIAAPTLVPGRRGSLARAVSCLLDNSTKFDTSDAPIELTVGESGVAVADRGPGIPEHELAMVFDRFHRADEARTMPGSGLGLSIVRDVAERHGGTVFAHNRDGGGAVIGFTIPPLPPRTS
jgi:two-component system sensor histidine kinase MprB